MHLPSARQEIAVRVACGVVGAVLLFAASTAQALPGPPVSASDGSNYVVCWLDGGAQCARIAADGTVAVQPHLVVSDAAHDLSIAFGGGEYALGFINGTGHQALARMATDDQTPLDASPVLMPGTALAVIPAGSLRRIAFDGNQFLVVWLAPAPSNSYSVYGARVSTAGTLLDPTGIFLQTATCPRVVYVPSASYTGANFLVDWSNGLAATGSVDGVRVSSAGVVLDSSPLVFITGIAFYAIVASYAGTDGLLVALSNDGGGNSSVRDVRIDAAGQILASGTLPLSDTSDLSEVDLVSLSTVRLLAWNSQHLHITRLSPSGSPLDSSPIATPAEVEPIGGVAGSSLATNGTTFLLTWAVQENCSNPHSGGLFAVRVDRNGSLLDTNPIVLIPGNPPPCPGPEAGPEAGDRADANRPSDANSRGDSGAAPGNDGAQSANGCGCSVGGRAPASSIAILVLGILTSAVRRRR